MEGCNFIIRVIKAKKINLSSHCIHVNILVLAYKCNESEDDWVQVGDLSIVNMFLNCLQVPGMFSDYLFKKM